jgi:hypothetical protein
MRIVSLTTIPPRFASLEPTLRSLLRQSADEVRVYVPAAYRRFPDWDGTLPRVPNGVKVWRCEKDYGPATKILPACSDLRGTDAQILFCDDDGEFAPGWAARLFALQQRRPGQAVAAYVRSINGYVSNRVSPRNLPLAWQLPIAWDLPYRARRVLFKYFGMPHPWRRPFARAGYGDVFFGVGGVVVRPGFFDDTAFEVPDEAWAVDDVWLSAQLARLGIPVYCPRRHPLPRALGQSDIASLFDMEVLGQGRQALNRVAAAYCRDTQRVWTS